MLVQSYPVHNIGCVYDLLEGSGTINSASDDDALHSYQEKGVVIEKGASATDQSKEYCCKCPAQHAGPIITCVFKLLVCADNTVVVSAQTIDTDKVQVAPMLCPFKRASLL